MRSRCSRCDAPPRSDLRPRLAALLILTLVGCSAGPQATTLTTWTLTQDGKPPEEVSLPAHLDDKLPRHESQYVLHTEAAIAPELRGHPLTLAVPYLPGIVHLVVEDEQLPDLESQLTDRYRSSGLHRFRIPGLLTRGATVRLAIVVEHRWTQAAWIDVAPTLGPHPEGSPRFRILRFFHVWSAATALAAASFGGIVYLMIFLADRRRKANGWFSLSSFAPGFYPLWVLGTSQVLFGTYDVLVTMFALCVSNVAGVHFAHAQYGLAQPSRWWGVSVIIPFLAYGVEPGPFGTSPLVPILSVSPIVATMVYLIYRYVKLFVGKPRPPGVAVILVCWIVLSLAAWTDILSWTGNGDLVGGVRTACLGIAFFALAQFIFLGTQHIASLRRADELNVELAGRVALLEQKHREVQVLNDELRHQVGERSGQLAEALARIGSPGGKASLFQAGEIIEKRYQVVRTIGAGGMGAVYEVERLADGKRLALKLMTLHASGPVLARFAREAEIASHVTHPNVVGIVDMDVSRSGSLFLVMELVDGRCLAEEKARFGDVRWGVPVLAQLARGLGAIHESGIVHRDLKPANVLLARCAQGEVPHVKIADFGVSSLADVAAAAAGSGILTPASSSSPTAVDLASSDTLQVGATPAANGSTNGGSGAVMSGLTQTGVIMGTPMYMAPELARGAKDARPSSDVYSFGLIAYEVLGGAPPFVEADVLERLRGRPGRTPSPLGELRKDVDARAAAVIDRCLAFEPSARPTAAEIAAALDESSPAVVAS